MKPIKYSTWVKLNQWVEDGMKAGTATCALIAEDIPIIGPLLCTGLWKLLGWSIKQILDWLPHQNEPRPESFKLNEIYDPVTQKYVSGRSRYVADPFMKGGVYYKPKMESITPGNPEMLNKLIQKAESKGILQSAERLVGKEIKEKPVRHLRDDYNLPYEEEVIDIPISVYPSKDTYFVTRRPRVQNSNPSYARVGF